MYVINTVHAQSMIIARKYEHFGEQFSIDSKRDGIVQLTRETMSEGDRKCLPGMRACTWGGRAMPC